MSCGKLKVLSSETLTVLVTMPLFDKVGKAQYKLMFSCSLFWNKVSNKMKNLYFKWKTTTCHY